VTLVLSGPLSAPTVLILGAGASVPYKFPTGEELFNRVRRTSIEFVMDQLRPASAALASPLQLAVRESLDRSLDALLELRADLVEAGKAFMARQLLLAEAGDRGAVEDSNEAWYRVLWDAFDLSSPEAFSRTPLTVITYNYDRSLEYRLMGALAQRFKLSVDQCAPLLKRVGPIHLHGQLGYLPGFKAGKKDIVAYGSMPPESGGITNEDCLVAARNIRIVNEPKPDDDAFVRARKAIQGAERVAFLGFGYARQNIERLQLANCMEPNIRLYLCAKGYTTEQAQKLIEPVFHYWNPRMIGLESEDIVKFLRHFPDLLT